MSAGAPTVPIDRASALVLAAVFKALADPTRLQLLATILDSPAGEECVCNLVESFPLSQATISHHLKILVDVGLLGRDKRGSWAWYGVPEHRHEEVRGLLAGSPSPVS